MKRTPAQNRALHALLGKLKLTAMKDTLVYTYSNERSKSSKDLTKQECQSLIDDLQGQLNMSEKRADRMRKKIISLTIHEHGWSLNDLDKFCKTRGYLKKGLNAYTYKELPKLVSQIELVSQSLNQTNIFKNHDECQEK